MRSPKKRSRQSLGISYLILANKMTSVLVKIKVSCVFVRPTRVNATPTRVAHWAHVTGLLFQICKNKLYRRSSAIILLVFHSRPVLDHWATLCVCVGGGGGGGVYPMSIFVGAAYRILTHAGATQTTSTDIL